MLITKADPRWHCPAGQASPCDTQKGATVDINREKMNNYLWRPKSDGFKGKSAFLMLFLPMI